MKGNIMDESEQGAHRHGSYEVFLYPRQHDGGDYREYREEHENPCESTYGQNEPECQVKNDKSDNTGRYEE